MSTVYSEAARNAVVSHVSDDPRWASILSDIVIKLNSNFYNKEFVRVFMQYSWHHGKYTLEDAYCFITTWGLIHDKKVGIVQVYVGETPVEDRNSEKNQALLDKGLSEHALCVFCSPVKFDGTHDTNNYLLFDGLDRSIFKASFYGGAGDFDGVFEWLESICLVTGAIEDGSSETVRIKNGTAPLEVGTTNAERTLTHVASGEGVARWPYDSEYITLLYPIVRMGIPVPYTRRKRG
jgi:hypothetical protein